MPITAIAAGVSIAATAATTISSMTAGGPSGGGGSVQNTQTPFSPSPGWAGVSPNDTPNPTSNEAPPGTKNPTEVASTNLQTGANNPYSFAFKSTRMMGGDPYGLSQQDGAFKQQ